MTVITIKMRPEGALGPTPGCTMEVRVASDYRDDEVTFIKPEHLAVILTNIGNRLS